MWRIPYSLTLSHPVLIGVVRPVKIKIKYYRYNYYTVIPCNGANGGILVITIQQQQYNVQLINNPTNNFNNFVCLCVCRSVCICKLTPPRKLILGL